MKIELTANGKMVLVIEIRYSLRDGFYELNYNTQRDEKFPAANLLHEFFENLMFQLQANYKIHNYYEENDIKKGFIDCEKEIKFIFAIIKPLIERVKTAYNLEARINDKEE